MHIRGFVPIESCTIGGKPFVGVGGSPPGEGQGSKPRMLQGTFGGNKKFPASVQPFCEMQRLARGLSTGSS
jgi:hypothetical protein